MLENFIKNNVFGVQSLNCVEGNIVDTIFLPTRVFRAHGCYMYYFPAYCFGATSVRFWSINVYNRSTDEHYQQE